MPYELHDHTQTLDYDVTGEQPVQYAYGPKLIAPDKVRLLVRNGTLDGAYVYGLAFTARGTLGKRRESFPLEGNTAPAWAVKLLAEHGLAFETGHDEDEDED